MADSPGAGTSYPDRFKSYVRTQKGSILAAEIIISLIVLICYAASTYGGYIAAAVTEMVFAIIFFFIFMMDLDKQFKMISWIWSDFFRAATGALIYLITSLICVIRGGSGSDSAVIAGGVFGLLAAALFAYDTYTIYLQMKGASQHSAAAVDDKV